MNEIVESIGHISRDRATADDYRRLRQAGKDLAVYALDAHTGDTLHRALAVSEAISLYCNSIEDIEPSEG